MQTFQIRPWCIIFLWNIDPENLVWIKIRKLKKKKKNEDTFSTKIRTCFSFIDIDYNGELFVHGTWKLQTCEITLQNYQRVLIRPTAVVSSFCSPSVAGLNWKQRKIIQSTKNVRRGKGKSTPQTIT